MDKKSLLVMALLGGYAMSSPFAVMAQTTPASASKTIYDFSAFSDSKFLQLFYNAKKAGKKYPSIQEFEAAGFSKHDLEFVRSHVRPRTVFTDNATEGANNLVNSLWYKRKLWANLPSGDGKTLGGYPNSNFSDDTYSMWNYTAVFGNWNHGLFQGPGAWADAAHKNGTDIYSGIKFFESWTAGSGDEAYSKLITEKEADGTFKYVEPVLNILQYFGTDGINYNWEDNSYSNTDVVAFHKALYKKAEEMGFKNFHIGIYTANNSLSGNIDAIYGTRSTGKTADVFLNYSGNDITPSVSSSVLKAEQDFGNADGVYAGVYIVTLNRSWENLRGEGYYDNTADKKAASKRANIVLWGEHANSRFWSYNTGGDAFEVQDNYQALLERVFSGGNRNPAQRPAYNDGDNYSWSATAGKAPMYNFPGMADFIPERSAIQGKLPFRTNFSLGNGERFNYKGKKTFGNWYNMAAQDVVPTYRWLVYKGGTTTVSTDVQPSFSHRDSYMGGSSLLLKGKAVSGGTDVVLFRTKLTAGTTPYTRVAVKWANGQAGPAAAKLSVILQKEGSTDWIAVPVELPQETSWKEAEVEIPGLAPSDVISRIGLRLEGTGEDCNLYVGCLELNNGEKVVPAEIKANSLKAEVKEETTQSLSVKLSWETEGANNEYGMGYNEDQNIDHFEVLYKDGASGAEKVVAKTTSWAAYLGNKVFDNSSEEPYFGVRAVGSDLKTYSAVQWLKVDRTAGVPAYSDKSYGTSQVNPASEGVDKARQQRYITMFKTEGAEVNLNYTASAPQADGTQYVDATADHKLVVQQGQQVTLKFKAADFGRVSAATDDGLRYCFAKAYLDLDESKTFSPEALANGGENIFDLGTPRKGTDAFQEPGITQQFTIPADARVGKSRLRVVFSDAWFTHPGPTGLTQKGFSIDFDVEIKGDPAQGRPKPADFHDQGEAEAPEASVTGVNTVVAGGVSKATIGADAIFLENVEKAWIYDVQGRFVKFVKDNPKSISTTDLIPGAYVIKMQYHNVIRSVKFVK